MLRFQAVADIVAAAAAFIAEHDSTDVLLLAASRSVADEFLRETCGAGALGIHRLTLTQAAASLAELAAHGLAPMSRLATEALSARITYELQKEGGLEYFEPVADTPGFARALASTLSELRMAGADLEQLAAGGPSGRDLAKLARRYQEEMERQGLADIAVVFELAAARAAGGEHLYSGLPILLLDVPVRSRRQAELVKALAARSPSTLAAVIAGDEETLRAYHECLGTRAVDAAPVETGTRLARVRKYVFSREAEPGAEPDGTIEFLSAPGEGLEFVEIARRMRQYARAGTEFDRMAVLLRSPERYQPLVEEALRRAGIPGYFSSGTVRPDPAGRAFLALLACAAEGCTASRFAEYLSLAQVPALDGSGAPIRKERAWAAAQDDLMASFGTAFAPEALEGDAPVAEAENIMPGPAAWERLLVDSAVIGGYQRWARRLKGLEAELELQSDDARREDPERAAAIERRLDQLRGLERFALPLIDRLAALPRQALWGEWLEQLTAIAQTALREPESVIALLGELRPMAEVGPAELDEMMGVLSERLRFLRTEPPPRRYGKVFVGTPEECRGRRFDVVFVPGLAEGIFPKRAFEDPLLLDDDRERLACGLARQDERVMRERLLLRAAAASAAKLVVSYPRMDTALARPRVPSFYALEVLRAAEGRLPDLREFEKRAAQAAPSRLGSPAPAQAADAIDDTEFDLARLEEIARLPSDERRGAGRHLVEANAHLGRALRTRWRRWQPFWSATDGLVDPEPAVRDILAKHKFDARSYSPTALQQYSACPYKFFLYAIHQLRPREEAAPLAEMDPLTRGALFHAVQFEIFAELEREGRLPVSPERLGEILDVADRKLDAVAANYREDLAPAIPRVWENEVEDLRTDLRGWIRHAAVSSAGWNPVRYEFEFGLRAGDREGRHDPHSVEEPAPGPCGLRLRGSIDLVERHAQRGVLRVVDHKTGRPPEPLPRYVGRGAFLQPLLYAIAAENLMGEPVESGRLSYCTQRGGFIDVEMPLTGTARQRVQQAVEIIARAVAEGFLPAAPQKDACSQCDYHAVCGPYEETRAARKPRARLDPLLVLRELP